MVLCTLTLKTCNYPLFLILIALAGFFIIPTTAAAIAFAGETTYPVEQTMVNGLISLAGHTVAGLVGMFTVKFIGEVPDHTDGEPYDHSQLHQQGTLWIFVGLTLIGAILTLFMDEDLRRSKAEKLEADANEEILEVRDAYQNNNLSIEERNINKTMETSEAHQSSQSLLD